MPKSTRKTHKPLEVCSMFEPTRLQQDVLQTAYAYLVPPLKRRMPSAAPKQLDQSALRAERNAQ